MDAVSLIRREMPHDLPLIGFAGSPWTLACYMVEGGSSRDFKQVLKLIYNEPQAAHQLLDKLAQAVSAYLAEQVKAGVNALMLFDTWGYFNHKPLSNILTQLYEKHRAIPQSTLPYHPNYFIY